VRVEEGMVVLSVEELHLFATGDTVEEAAADLAEQIVWVWDTYGRRPDDELTAEAREFKQAVRSVLTEGDAA